MSDDDDSYWSLEIANPVEREAPIQFARKKFMELGKMVPVITPLVEMGIDILAISLLGMDHLRLVRSGGYFTAKYSLYVPILNQYRLDVFYLLQDPSGYPVYVLSEFINSTEVRCEDEKTFQKQLKLLLGSSRIAEIVTNIRSMAKMSQS